MYFKRMLKAFYGIFRGEKKEEKRRDFLKVAYAFQKC